MSGEKANGALIGVGVAACAVCCAGPILGVLAAIGLSTGVGYALFGVGAVIVGAAVAVFVVLRRRRERQRQLQRRSVPTPVKFVSVGHRS